MYKSFNLCQITTIEVLNIFQTYGFKILHIEYIFSICLCGYYLDAVTERNDLGLEWDLEKWRLGKYTSIDAKNELNLNCTNIIVWHVVPKNLMILPTFFHQLHVALGPTYVIRHRATPDLVMSSDSLLIVFLRIKLRNKDNGSK